MAIPSLLAQVLDAAKARGLDQRSLAEATGMRPEAISRAKRRDNIPVSMLQDLAAASGLTVSVGPISGAPPAPARTRSSLADPKWGLAWSNADAPAQALVRNALIRGNFALVLEAVLEHGLPYTKRQLASLKRDPDEPVSPAAAKNLERMLVNISKGLGEARRENEHAR